MDRNLSVFVIDNVHSVALRKESVDRNVKILVKSHGNNRSLSARRAWIEIKSLRFTSCSLRVALRKESVDRNIPGAAYDRNI